MTDVVLTTTPRLGDSAARAGSTLAAIPTQVGSLQASSECLLASWVGETLLSAELAAQGNPEALSIFWVRLYGLLTDVADFVALTLEDTHESDGLCMFPLARGTARVSPLPVAMARLRSIFEEDDLIYIEYRRHAECDPFQTRYRARRRHGAALLVPSILLGGRAVTGSEAEAALQRLLRKHDLSEPRLGSELARRSIVALRAVRAAAS